jgi:hypothetical protein
MGKDIRRILHHRGTETQRNLISGLSSCAAFFAAKDLCIWRGMHRSFGAKNAPQDDKVFW